MQIKIEREGLWIYTSARWKTKDLPFQVISLTVRHILKILYKYSQIKVVLEEFLRTTRVTTKDGKIWIMSWIKLASGQTWDKRSQTNYNLQRMEYISEVIHKKILVVPTINLTTGCCEFVVLSLFFFLQLQPPPHPNISLTSKFFTTRSSTSCMRWTNANTRWFSFHLRWLALAMPQHDEFSRTSPLCRTWPPHPPPSICQRELLKFITLPFI